MMVLLARLRVACRRTFVLLAAMLCLAPAVAAETLTLADGLRVVTEENRLVRIKQQEERMSHADTIVARSRLLPQVGAAYAQSFMENQPGLHAGAGPITPIAEKSSYTYQLAIQQILYDFGGVTSLYQAAKLTEDTKRLDTTRTRNSVALAFTLLYFDVLESEKMVAVAEKEIDSLASHARVARELLQNGLITKNDLLQAEVRLADARQKLLNAQNLRKINGARVNSMLTRPLSTPFEVTEVTKPHIRTGDAAEAEAAEKERPEVQIVDATLKALAYEETARRSEYFPRFFAQAERDYVKNKYLAYENNMSITFNMSINLFSGGSTSAALQKAQLARSRLAIERKRLVDDIGLEIEKYHLDAVNAAASIRVAEGAISQAEENLRITGVKYAEGIGIARDVTDAIALRSLSETNYYRALYDCYRSEAGYLYATGKNLKEEYTRGER